MSNIVEPILKLMKSNQGRAVAVSAVLAGLAISYSLLSSGKPSSKKEKEVCLVSRRYSFYRKLECLQKAVTVVLA